jgi:hypothetical protein
MFESAYWCRDWVNHFPDIFAKIGTIEFSVHRFVLEYFDFTST